MLANRPFPFAGRGFEIVVYTCLVSSLMAFLLEGKLYIFISYIFVYILYRMKLMNNQLINNNKKHYCIHIKMSVIKRRTKLSDRSPSSVDRRQQLPAMFIRESKPLQIQTTIVHQSILSLSNKSEFILIQYTIRL